MVRRIRFLIIISLPAVERVFRSISKSRSCLLIFKHFYYSRCGTNFDANVLLGLDVLHFFCVLKIYLVAHYKLKKKKRKSCTSKQWAIVILRCFRCFNIWSGNNKKKNHESLQFTKVPVSSFLFFSFLFLFPTSLSCQFSNFVNETIENYSVTKFSYVQWFPVYERSRI